MAGRGSELVQQLLPSGTRQRGADEAPGWVGFLGGLLLGALVGGALARLLALREQERDAALALQPEPEAILLHERGDSAEPDDEAPITLPDVVPDAAVAPAALAAAGALDEAEAPLGAAEADPDIVAGAAGDAGDEVVPVAGTCPPSHPIKGNHGAGGELIYHVPEGQLYARTNAEACFATEEAAQAAGYRRSKR